MKLTVFTSNHPRHLSLVHALSKIADEVYVVQECKTILTGRVDDHYKKSDVMAEYFDHMMRSEQEVFGDISFMPTNARSLSIKTGDLSSVPLETLQDALKSDAYVIFGASYIRGPLIDFLVENHAVNIHMGVSPYYRGNSCNFWAIYDGRPDLVGATIHLLSKGLDTGQILFHALPEAVPMDPFVFGMRAVKVAHLGLAARILDGTLLTLEGVEQNKQQEIRYSRRSEFTDELAAAYLADLPTREQIGARAADRNMSDFRLPFIG